MSKNGFGLVGGVLFDDNNPECQVIFRSWAEMMTVGEYFVIMRVGHNRSPLAKDSIQAWSLKHRRVVWFRPITFSSLVEVT